MTFLLYSASLADDLTQPLATQKEKESYSIGYQVGRSMVADEVEVDFKRLIQGVQDAISGNRSPLGDEEMKKLIVDLRTRARDIQLRKYQESLVKNAAESEKFFAENRKNKGVETTASGLQYEILKEGDGLIPTSESVVKVNYKGTFIDGTEFDNSIARGESPLLKVDTMIKGWSEAVRMMKVGSTWRLFVPPDLAYGRGGLGGKIPGNKGLIFDVELVAIGETNGQEERIN